MIGNRTRACYSVALLAWNSRVSAFQSTTGNPILLQPLNARSNRHFSLTSILEMSAESTEATVDVAANLDFVRQQLEATAKEAMRDPSSVRLVAVSKTKPLELIKDAYEHGQRVFGENYVQELVEKAKTLGEEAEKNEKYRDLEWHFIGALQSNKANLLVKSVVPFGKLTVETVSSLKLAKKLDNAMDDETLQAGRDVGGSDGPKKLDVFVQVNTSGEESKSGVSPNEVADLCQQISQDCSHLNVRGVMTIGAPGDVECLEKLASCREAAANALGVSADLLELSMGMSDDFEAAIRKGSTNVRVGSTIFGARDYSNKK